MGRKSISPLDKINLKRDLFKNPNKTSANYFSAMGIPLPSIATRCSILNEFAKCKKAFYKPVLKKSHKEKRFTWAKTYLKQDFSKVFVFFLSFISIKGYFYDESRCTLDGPDGWDKIWLLKDSDTPIRFKRQQGAGGIMIWAGIYNNKVIRPFLIPQGIKINYESYIQLIEWGKSPFYKLNVFCILYFF